MAIGGQFDRFDRQRVYLFAINSEGEVLTIYWAGSWDNWKSLSGSFSPKAIIRSTFRFRGGNTRRGRTDIFGIFTDGKAYMNSNDYPF